MARYTFRNLWATPDLVAHPEILTGSVHTNEPCPLCGGPVEIVLDGLVDGKPRPFAACSACEYCAVLDVKRATQPTADDDPPEDENDPDVRERHAEYMHLMEQYDRGGDK